MTGDGRIRVEIALRAGMIAKAALEMVAMEPALARLQLAEVAKQLAELDDLLRRHRLASEVRV